MCQAAVVHLCTFQSVLIAAARLVVIIEAEMEQHHTDSSRRPSLSAVGTEEDVTDSWPVLSSRDVFIRSYSASARSRHNTVCCVIVRCETEILLGLLTHRVYRDVRKSARSDAHLCYQSLLRQLTFDHACC